MSSDKLQDSIKECVFKYLDGQPDVQSLRFKEVREHVEAELNLEKESCKTGTLRQLLEQHIASYIKDHENVNFMSSKNPDNLQLPSHEETSIAQIGAEDPLDSPQATAKQIPRATKKRVKAAKAVEAAALMPTPVNFNENVRKAVNSYLDQFDDPSTVKFKDVREHVESELDLGKDSMKTGTSRHLLEQFVSAYVKSKESIELSKIVNDPTNSSGEVVVKGRFSAKEVEIIQKAVETYCEMEGLQPQDLVVYYREDNRRPRHRKLVDSILAQLPHRTSTVSCEPHCSLSAAKD